MYERMMAAIAAIEGKLHRTGTYYYVDAELRELRSVADGLKPYVTADEPTYVVSITPPPAPTAETITEGAEHSEMLAKAAALGIETDAEHA